MKHIGAFLLFLVVFNFSDIVDFRENGSAILRTYKYSKYIDSSWWIPSAAGFFVFSFFEIIYWIFVIFF